jgi:uncharacterized cupredoxin-like copper-binding protein
MQTAHTPAPRPARRQLLRWLLLPGAAALPPLAGAHTAGSHAKPAGPVKKEQKEWGIAGDDRGVRRSIDIAMTYNMRFTPDRITVRLGETVRFRIRNQGQLLHEMVIGTPAELAEHAALMAKFPNMEHDEPYMAHVEKGRSAQMLWHFNRAGEFEFACLIAGHFQAGMVGRITVLPR